MTQELRLKGWSHARLLIFEQCNLRAKFQFVDRIPEVFSPELQDIISRGERAHSAAEHYVRGKREDLAPELAKFAEEFAQLRTFFAAGQVELEAEWGFDPEWKAISWRDATCRIKCDAVVRTSPTTATVIDYKTGKRAGKEIKHGEQMQLYQLGTFLRYPELEEVTVELWYLDQDTVIPQTFSRRAGMKFLRPFEQRAKALLDCRAFKPNPNIWSCRYCPYSKRAGNGRCLVGV